MTLFSWIVEGLQQLGALYYVVLFLGGIAFLTLLVEVAYGVCKLFRKRIDFRQRYGEGAWALVTGGSEGTTSLITQALAENWQIN